ncbi:S-layer homology domain-containing protein [Paenibacillus sp. KQZ6P-2]|uniref:S-layer homology domain-containing protein n=1 Tax=Paenibacillus mangrovi TaxID=2931978 RepID=A0A9X2B263_9BACL|nr:PQQ-binding-like beta-propeller repeat protein [Paenibacillus mangrovi]MCJ8011595.1 S-layer homology domain-containing protein [Paenibacillus mangrovi]
MSSSKQKFGIVLISALISVSVLFPFPAAAAEAPKFTIDPNLKSNDLLIKDTPLLLGNPKGQVRWEYPMEKPSTSPVLGKDGTIYLGGGNKVYAILPDGTKKWDADLGGFASGTPTLGADGMLYVGVIKLDANALKAYVYVCAIDPAGKKKWEFAMGGLKKLSIPDLSPAIGADGTIYAGGSDSRNLYALYPDGSLKWASPAEGAVSPPSIGEDGTIYAGTMDGVLYAFKPNGIVKWTFPTPSPIYEHPVIGADGTIYVESYWNDSGAVLYAIHPDGSKKWSRDRHTYSSPSIAIDGTIYIGSKDGVLAFDPDGTEKWKFNPGNKVHQTPAIGRDGTIYAGSDNSVFYAVNPDRTVKWEYAARDIGTFAPVIGSDGTVYKSSSTSLLALGTIGVSTVSLNKKTTSLQAGTSETLTATIVPEEAVDKRIRWSSSNSAVAEVDAMGKVTGIAPGTANITATTIDGGFIATCAVTVTDNPPAPQADAANLKDIAGHKLGAEIAKALALGIVFGYPDGTFRPNGNVTRAEFASMLVRGLHPGEEGAPLTFKDKDKIGAWAVKAVRQAVKLGIIHGYEDGTFRPNANITHAEMISMVIRASGLSMDNALQTGLSDDADIPEWAKSAVSKAEKTGIIKTGDFPDGKLAPQAMSTRAEAASAIVRMLEVRE